MDDVLALAVIAILALSFLGAAGFFIIVHSSPRDQDDEPIISSPERDKRFMERGTCPDCGEKSLLSGPSGGMSQNVACNNCLMEFNVHHSFGGLLGVDRTGKLSETRAGVFGISPEEYREIVKDDPRDKLEPYYNHNGN